ncbi:MAG: sulfatase family protein [Planctomycetota bacterium]|jgi:arylsulfatase A-like enzyme
MIKKYGPDEQSFRELIARYWGLVSQVDASVGKILDTLDQVGLAEDTIVVYTSDHGDMMGSHKLVTKGVMYEEAARIPWLMRVPWMTGKQQMVAQPVSQIDMVPTLLELMGRNTQTQLPGHSLVPLMQGRKAAEDYVFIQWNGDVTTRTVVTADGWKLCLSKGDKSQLFNLNKDPGETINLFDSGRHSDIIDRLTKKIHEWQEKVQDTVKV